jgi:hypothetical protein
MILGFTGTRYPITDAQTRWLGQAFDSLRIDMLHHGACVGADLAAHECAVAHELSIVVHPPTNPKLVALQCLKSDNTNVLVLPAKPYLNRNRDIVGACDGVMALPDGPDPGEYTLSHSGTWYTVHYAVRMNKPVIICYPDGQIEKRNQRGQQ